LQDRDDLVSLAQLSFEFSDRVSLVTKKRPTVETSSLSANR
jgi:hypothetical protein